MPPSGHFVRAESRGLDRLSDRNPEGADRGIRERNLDAGASRRLRAAEVVEPESFADRGIKGILGEEEVCLARYRLHTAVVEGPEGDDDRGIKGIFGESEACLARFRLHAGGVVAILIVL